MDENLIERIELENGLTLELIDQSRQIAADRYKVVLLSRIEVQIVANWFAGDDVLISKLNDMTARLGTAVVFEKTNARFFVEAENKDHVLRQMQTLVKQSLQPYYAHPDFARNFILKKYADSQKAGTPQASI